ncbi:hypothetical protein JS531_03670 [Bifidobacterium sp. CP2]|uniref:hypothetical protein n=1 Tax=Bifidobacterium sp. CP2 TaxID=2809025 RepID=UPI001BDCCA94|nr:hypothetical protein [Bifidobacterium sp. CP2]MBT1181081.1 hypothetical protein [Bifidobacterium sp. CP2]
MARVPAGGRFSFRTCEDPFDYRERGWKRVDDTAKQLFPFGLPSWLSFMCISGRERPWYDSRGRIKKYGGSLRRKKIRDGWMNGYMQNLNSARGGRASDQDGYYPVHASLGGLFFVDILRAPFPVTLDDQLIAYAACSIGETEWVPFAPLINGRCSMEMLRLMNMFPHKPAFIICRGWLYVWVNVEHWRHIEPKVSQLDPQPYIELELFRAYRVYYEQLRRELPAPFMGPVCWPDQCDPRFPLPGDPRGAHYGMWIYSGGLTYGENTLDTTYGAGLRHAGVSGKGGV